MTSGASPSRSWVVTGSRWWAPPLAVTLSVATLLRHGLTADAVVFALVQVLLVWLAAIDLASHRLPNALTIPSSLGAIALRALFERGTLGDALIAGCGALALFALLSVILRGGIGMGDVKLAGMLGFVLGSAVVPALVIGVFAGALAAVVLLALRSATLGTRIAYGPYLALGGAIAILTAHPSPLV